MKPLLETGAWKYGALTGVFMTLQLMSSIYYGVFLATLAGLVAVLLLCGMRGPRLKDSLAALAIGAVLAILLAAPYAAAYLATKQELGGRSEEQVLTFSAPPSSYTVATDSNYLYGERSAPRGRPERRLFPGILAVLLAVVGLLLRQPSAAAIAYLLALAAAFEMSLGAYGYSFGFLYRYVPVFDALRAPARLGIFVVFFLALLAAWGHAAVEAALPRTGRRALAAAIWGVLLLEYWVAPLRLVPYPNAPPPLYAWLAQQPRGVVAEFPMPVPEALPGDEARYAYMSTFHWMPAVNGYSGYYPPVLHRADRQAPRISRRRFDRCAATRRRPLRDRSSRCVRAGPSRTGAHRAVDEPVIHYSSAISTTDVPAPWCSEFDDAPGWIRMCRSFGFGCVAATFFS